MKLRCSLCKSVIFKSLHVSREKAVEEVLLKFGPHIQRFHNQDTFLLSAAQHKLTGLIGTIMLADLLEPVEGDTDCERFTEAVDKAIDSVLEALGIETVETEETSEEIETGEEILEGDDTIITKPDETASESNEPSEPADETAT